MSDFFLSNEEKKAAEAFVDRMLQFTQRLMLIVDGKFKTAASGVIVKHKDRFFLLSAGHALKEAGQWIVETNITCYPPQMLVLTVQNPVTFYSTKEDFAWAEVDVPGILKKYKAEKKLKYSKLQIPCYTGPLDTKPDPEDAYAFASHKAIEFHVGIATLVREARYEIYMQFEGMDEAKGLYRFKLARKHQGDDYYTGCSGSPIADAEGRIISLVVSGSKDPEPGVIWGTPLANYLAKIGEK